ncbi:MAG: EF2563 family selenium-dependent molybdenum hydroxylase system protein [Anaerolineae bacterium]|nr:MAG: EF2563 family selenium-dependent molybdenum hydroxylase system protein [Anaerolineae bacterium]
MGALILLRGGGDLASGVAYRLYRAGLKVVITELPEPLAVRRRVAFAEAVYTGRHTVEGVTARRATPDEVDDVLGEGDIPVVVDPAADILNDSRYPFLVLVDGRMTKRPPDLGLDAAPLVIGLGPGFVAGENCHAVVETHRGHTLGRVYWQGAPLEDTGIPEAVAGHRADRVLRAPADGVLKAYVEIGEHLEQGQVIADVAGQPIRAPFGGVLRGLVHPGLRVQQGMKVGDLDPRDDPRYCTLISDKSLAIGGGVLEAILSRVDLRARLWD